MYGCRWSITSVRSDAELLADTHPNGLRSRHKQLRQSREDRQAPPTTLIV